MPVLRRHFSAFDNCITRLQQPLAPGQAATAPARANPAADLPATPLSESERTKSAALMRVNHAGEVCAQALYHGQAWTARTDKLRQHLYTAAAEEADHLAWCEQRLVELQDHTSHLNPLWYGGSLALGALAGLAGDRWSLGFVAETERQVEQHLEGHRQRLPAIDRRSRAIVEQMQLDETRHGRQALEAGGVMLPAALRWMMRGMAKIMTTTAHRF